MRGTPVWLASVSRPKRIDTGHGLGRLATGLWGPTMRSASEDLLLRALDQQGDPARERLFRMNITMCLHRALRPDELERLPDWFFRGQAIDLAGGPIEVLRETEAGSASTRPCHAPVRGRLPGETDPLIWVPFDCGRCPPCVARAAYNADLDAMVGEGSHEDRCERSSDPHGYRE